MKFTSFLQSLIPGFEKSRVLEDIRITKTEYKETTIPAYEGVISLLKNKEIKSKEIQDFEKIFRRNNPGFNKDLFLGIFEGLKIAEANLDVVETLIEKTYNEDVAAGGLTYLKANLLQYVELSGFVSKFARKFLHYVFIMESAEFEANSLQINESMSKAEIRWIEENFLNFSHSFKIVSIQKTKMEKHLSEVPDIVITKDNEDHLMQSNGSKIDPFSMRFIPAWLNIIYHVRVHVAEWQVSRYKASKEELKVIQLRKLHLERLQQNKPDAKIEKEIAYLESRVQELNYKIEKIEKEA